MVSLCLCLPARAHSAVLANTVSILSFYSLSITEICCRRFSALLWFVPVVLVPVRRVLVLLVVPSPARCPCVLSGPRCSSSRVPVTSCSTLWVPVLAVSCVPAGCWWPAAACRRFWLSRRPPCALASCLELTAARPERLSWIAPQPYVPCVVRDSAVSCRVGARPCLVGLAPRLSLLADALRRFGACGSLVYRLVPVCPG